MKITIIGDIICDKPMLKAAKKTGFKEMFNPLKEYLKDSDYVIANLETSISNKKHTKNTFSFCNPPTLLDTLKENKINYVSLANNHILDRGIKGIENTIQELKKRNIEYFGINNKILEIENVVILGYTDSTNYNINKTKSNEKYNINVLKDTYKIKKRKTKNIFKKIYYKIKPDIRLTIEKILRIKIKPIIDNYEEEIYLEQIKNQIQKLKKEKKYIIIYPHMGGQYNINIGTFTKNTIQKIKKIGCDSIIITHPHIIQNTYKYKNVFSIGGVVMSPKSKFVIWETLPEYSATINYYFKNNKLEKTTISFLICIKDKKNYLKIYPFYDFYNNLEEKEKIKYKKQFDIIFKRIFNNTDEIKKEYVVEE